jgi:2-polyprenyl-3-methyl-5-hydroxy-6-metoxy-1,4-benzoquinol methylase
MTETNMFSTLTQAGGRSIGAAENVPGVADLKAAVAGGHFGRTLFDPRNGVIGWSHRARFAFGLKLLNELRPATVLDYGCGDGTFVALATQAGRRCTGAELSSDVVAECRRRFAELPLDFRVMTAIVGSFDVVTCMEVLEHTADPGKILDCLKVCVAPGGHVLISVPIETGISLLAKGMGRKLAGWRGVDAYAAYAEYSWSELVRSVFAGERQHITRVLNLSLYGVGAYEHKGFNWKVLRGMIAERFQIVATHYTPLPMFGPLLNSQAWIVATKGE